MSYQLKPSTQNDINVTKTRDKMTPRRDRHDGPRKRHTYYGRGPRRTRYCGSNEKIRRFAFESSQGSSCVRVVVKAKVLVIVLSNKENREIREKGWG